MWLEIKSIKNKQCTYPYSMHWYQKVFIIKIITVVIVISFVAHTTAVIFRTGAACTTFGRK